MHPHKQITSGNWRETHLLSVSLKQFIIHLENNSQNLNHRAITSLKSITIETEKRISVDNHSMFSTLERRTRKTHLGSIPSNEKRVIVLIKKPQQAFLSFTAHAETGRYVQPKGICNCKMYFVWFCAIFLSFFLVWSVPMVITTWI